MSNLRDEIARRRAQLTPEQAARLSQRLRATPAVGAVLPPKPRAPSASVPLSFAQERIWFLSQLDPGSAAYHVGNAIRLRGDLKLPLLQQALDLIVARHEVLRTTFPIVDGLPSQQIGPAQPAPFVISDLRAQQHGDDRLVQQLIQHEVEQPFDLAAAPPWRVRLLQASDDDQVLVITMHHIISDGWSWDVLLSELATLYNQLTSAIPHPEGTRLPPLPLHYADIALWQRNLSQQPAMQEHIDYWAAQLRDLPPPLTLPTDHPRAATPNPPKTWLTQPIPDDLQHALQALS
ncbi:MAG: hypothetical protein JOZ51_28390, partial [Chloroflexi bacterium]|nr:hypothetical protein [Chloroflexota bacterium]